MAVKLSVIVPVYNVEKYVGKCLDSLLNQDLPKDDYEIIIVDDGATDSCPTICDNYAEHEPRIRVIHQSNQGLSVARNVGIKNAKGIYIQFVDSDDYIESNVLGALVSRMERDELDVLRFGYQQVNEAGKVTRSNPIVDISEVLTGERYLNTRLGVACYACQFMLSRSLLIDNGLFFKPGIIFEDTFWTPKMLQAADRVSDTTMLVYNYLEREGSITLATSLPARRKKLEAQLVLLDEMCAQKEMASDTTWYEMAIAHIVITVITDIGLYHFSERKKYLSFIRSKSVYPLSLRGANRGGRRKIRVVNFSPELFCFLVHSRHTNDS